MTVGAEGVHYSGSSAAGGEPEDPLGEYRGIKDSTHLEFKVAPSQVKIVLDIEGSEPLGSFQIVPTFWFISFFKIMPADIVAGICNSSMVHFLRNFLFQIVLFKHLQPQKPAGQAVRADAFRVINIHGQGFIDKTDRILGGDPQPKVIFLAFS